MSGSRAPASDGDDVNLDCLPLRMSTEIQGNILAGFNKDHQWFLLLRFADQERGRAWLGAVTPDISTTRDVASFNQAFRGARRQLDGRDPEGDQWKQVWLGLGITSAGLLQLAASLTEDLRGFLAFRAGPADPKRAGLS